MCFMAFYGNIKKHVFSFEPTIKFFFSTACVLWLHFLFLLFFIGVSGMAAMNEESDRGTERELEGSKTESE